MLGRVTLDCVNPYTFTASTLAWAGLRAASGVVRGVGALGPLDAFGLAGVREACAGLAAPSFEPDVWPAEPQALPARAEAQSAGSDSI